MPKITGINNKLVATTMRRARIPGVSVAYVDSRTHAFSTISIGTTDKHAPRAESPVRSDTVFGAASLSKAVFAYLVLKLIEQEKLTLPGSAKFDLDTPLYKLFSLKNYYKKVFNQELSDEDVIKARGLTTRMVLSHQSGIPISGAPKFNFEPGSAYGYSGLPLMYLQSIIEKQTGKSLDVLAREEIFKPLKMTQSTFLPQDRPNYMAHTVSSRAKSMKKVEKPKPNAANSVHTTARDYARFVDAWMKDTSEIMQEGFRPQVSLTHDAWAKDMGVSEKDCEHLAWGLGFGLELNDKGKAIKAFHTGDMNQWRAQVAINLENRSAVVYFANGRHHKDANGHVLSDLIIGPKIEVNHAMNWFYKKFGFARNTDGDWQKREAQQMKTIGEYLRTGIAPKTIEFSAAHEYKTTPSLSSSARMLSLMPQESKQRTIKSRREEIAPSKASYIVGKEASRETADDRDALNTKYKSPTPFKTKPEPGDNR